GFRRPAYRRRLVPHLPLGGPLPEPRFAHRRAAGQNLDLDWPLREADLDTAGWVGARSIRTDLVFRPARPQMGCEAVRALPCPKSGSLHPRIAWWARQVRKPVEAMTGK